MYSRQEVIYEQPKFTGVNEGLEQIFGEPSGAKEEVLKEA